MDKILHDIAAVRRFRNPIHGFIRLNETEMKIIDTPLFQRLRRIHQLALTKYVYPAAESSRFIHSLGVVNTAIAMLAAVNNHKETSFSVIDIASDARILRLAALLHDIGHMPFSHGAEEALLGNLRHEDFSYFIIANYDPIREQIDKNNIPPEVVGSLLTN